MKNFIKLAAATFILSTTIFFSCSKEDEISRTDLLTETIWRELAYVVNGINQPIFDCDEDDKYIFGKDGMLCIDPGTKDCGFPKYSMPWRLSADQKILYAGIDDGGDEPWKILEINKQKLKIEYNDTVDSALQVITLIPY